MRHNVITAKSAGKRLPTSSASSKKLMPTSSGPIPHLLQTRLLSGDSSSLPEECSERPTKRQKLTLKKEEKEREERIQWEDHITLALVEIKLVRRGIVATLGLR